MQLRPKSPKKTHQNQPPWALDAEQGLGLQGFPAPPGVVVDAMFVIDLALQLLQLHSAAGFLESFRLYVWVL